MDDRRQDQTGATGRGAAVVVPVAHVGGSGRIVRWVTIVAVLVSLAIVKPWGGGDTTSGARALATGAATDEPGPSAAATRVPPSHTAGIDADVTRACLDPGSWRVASVEAYGAQTIRVWRALEPGTASGPADPAIPYVLVVSEGVTELGWCAPVAGSDRPTGETTVQAWTLGDGTARPLRLVRTGRTPHESTFGALYGPLSAVTGRRAPEVTGWPAGQYVFRLRLEDGDERWFGVDLELRPAVLTQRPGPSPAPGVRLP